MNELPVLSQEEKYITDGLCKGCKKRGKNGICTDARENPMTYQARLRLMRCFMAQGKNGENQDRLFSKNPERLVVLDMEKIETEKFKSEPRPGGGQTEEIYYRRKSL